MRRKARIDGNHRSIKQALQGIPGLTIADTSGVGCGFPDLVVGWRGRNYMLEIKDPAQPKSKRGLTDDQRKFHIGWRGQIEVVETIEDVLRVLNHPNMGECPLT